MLFCLQNLNNSMNHLLRQTSFLALILLLAASCSRTPYASFGGGPKRLTAGPKKQYAQANPGKLETSTVAQNEPVAESEVPFYTPKAETSKHLRKALRKLNQAEANASVARLSTAEKIQVAREVYQIKKEIEKSEVIQKEAATTEGKSQVLAAILCFFLGGLGIHRFYLGYIWQGVVQLLTAGGCGLWALIDFIRILMGDLKPKGGSYTKTLDDLDI